jgi:hypothetical protein
MSDFIRAIAMKMSHKGICRKCGLRRDESNHSKCDRFRGGFQYHANTTGTTIAELRKIVELLAQGEHDDTPIQFKLHVQAVRSEQ